MENGDKGNFWIGNNDLISADFRKILLNILPVSIFDNCFG
jgi:uncharacterized protein YwqG